MTASIHRLLTTIGGICAAVAGVIGVADYEVLGIPSEVAAALGLVGAILVIVANGIRANYAPATELNK
jgi:hypothetical protein